MKTTWTALLGLSLVCCSSIPQATVYRGVEPQEVNAVTQVPVARAAQLLDRLEMFIRYEPKRNIDRAPQVNERWVDWQMPDEQHLRLERHEAGVWRLMRREGPKQWQPWYYLPERTATFVAAGAWNDNSEPIAVVAYGTDVIVLLGKVWMARRGNSPIPDASAALLQFRRREKDWADLDLASVMGDPTHWRVLLDPDIKVLWVLPVKSNALDPSREGWRFELTMPFGVLYRQATRLQFTDASGQVLTVSPVAAAPASTPQPAAAQKTTQPAAKSAPAVTGSKPGKGGGK